MPSTHFSQPEDVEGTRPDSETISRQAAAAHRDILSAHAGGWSGVLGVASRHTVPLFQFSILRIHGWLGEFNNLLLPPLLTLVVIEVVTGVLPNAAQVELGAISLVFGLSFATEWVIGLGLARQRRTYLTNVWLLLDLVSSIPLGPALQFLRIARFARILRFMRLLKLFRARRFGFPVGKLFRAFAVSFSLATAGAMALQALEPDTVSGFADAMWWSMVTISTVGYGDIAPNTLGGRFVAVALMVVGIGVFSYLAGVMATSIFDPEEDALHASVLRLEDEVRRLSEKIDQIR